jgi:hypothetical protein
MTEEVKEEKKVEAPVATPITEPMPAPAHGPEPTVGGSKKLSWVLTLVLSILVGSLGVDRFMMGQIGLGILKLITGGGCGVWWLIDVILIAMKKDFPGIEWTD